MLYKNAYVFDCEKGFVFGGFSVENGCFSNVFSGDSNEDGVDLCGAYVIPGLIDIHIHGAVGADFSDGNQEGLDRMAAFLAKSGVTSFLPTSMTLPYETLSAAFQTAKNRIDEPLDGCARVLGIHMEGPYFSEKKRGAQNAAYLKKPDPDGFRALYNGCGGSVRIVDVAPELEGAAAFTKEISSFCKVSVAHTDSAYEDASAVFAAGADHLTHLFNAMPPIHHRKPGVIGAASEREDIVAELICDGQHIHPSIVRLAFRLFPGRICLISDALRCCGMPDGAYELGGQTVYLKDNVARLEDGTIAGAASHLFRDLRNAVAFGIPLKDAINAATLIPAKEAGYGDSLGSIEKGKHADFVICDPELQLQQVFIGGNSLPKEEQQ